MLEDLKAASQHFPPLERILQTEQPTGIILTPVEAFAFMRTWAIELEDAGFHVDVPDWATPEQGELSLRLSLTPVEHDDETLEGVGPDGGQNGHALSAGGRVGLDSLVRFDWRVAVGQQQLTPAEFEQLVNQQSPLVRFRDRWIQIDLEAAKKAQAAMEKNANGSLTLGEAFRVAYGLAGDAGVPVSGLTGSDWIDRLLSQAPDGAMGELPQPPGFKGELRPYQLRGLQWMAYLDRLGLGACLADDMGLGKTIQFISLLLQERQAPVNGKSPDGPTLLFAPASVVGNWTRELARFAPDLKVMAHHGPDRLHGDAFVEAANAHDVVLIGYALAHRDQTDLRRVKWHRLAMDEAQKVKNPQAASSIAIRSLTAHRRVALTGTPIENHLSELWSIMEVLNPGLLGTAGQFRERFVIPVERMADPKRGQLLRELIRPFVLRRTKQDPEVAVNLPSKMEMRVFTELKPEQAAMYERITADMLTSVENASGIQRRGLILAGLTRLKQVCDHPALLTPDNKHIEGRSGKSERLIEMLEEVLAEGEASLVFTQFREMGHLLEKLIHSQLGQTPLFLHGGVPVKDRDKMIQEFQTPGTKHRIFILSLRAGGLGLNLTAANHVFHYDRWWNPAVEAQATDRAHRIGQQKIVQVHKFVSIGTVEEKIDKLLADKTQLAENIVTSGDQWLTNLSTDKLKEYLSLSTQAVEEVS
ncbi:MAG: DEAD/DEAH box helicase [Tepidisphaeraceae bacterium]